MRRLGPQTAPEEEMVLGPQTAPEEEMVKEFDCVEELSVHESNCPTAPLSPTLPPRNDFLDALDQAFTLCAPKTTSPSPQRQSAPCEVDIEADIAAAFRAAKLQATSPEFDAGPCSNGQHCSKIGEDEVPGEERSVVSNDAECVDTDVKAQLPSASDQAEAAPKPPAVPQRDFASIFGSALAGLK